MVVHQCDVQVIHAFEMHHSTVKSGKTATRDGIVSSRGDLHTLGMRSRSVADLDCLTTDLPFGVGGYERGFL